MDDKIIIAMGAAIVAGAVGTATFGIFDFKHKKALNVANKNVEILSINKDWSDAQISIYRAACVNNDPVKQAIFEHQDFQKRLEEIGKVNVVKNNPNEDINTALKAHIKDMTTDEVSNLANEVVECQHPKSTDPKSTDPKSTASEKIEA